MNLPTIAIPTMSAVRHQCPTLYVEDLEEYIPLLRD